MFDRYPTPPTLLRCFRGGSRHGSLRRVVGLVVFLSFMAGWAVDAGGLHHCPHHDLAHDPGHDHGESHADMGSHAEASDSVPPAEHEGPCTCRTDCTGATPIRASTPPSVERLPEALAAASSDPVQALLPSRILLPHVLPWSTAPPRH